MDFEKIIKSLESEIISKVGEENYRADESKVDEVISDLLPKVMLLNPPVFGTAITMVIDTWCQLHKIDSVDFIKQMALHMDIAKTMANIVGEGE